MKLRTLFSVLILSLLLTACNKSIKYFNKGKQQFDAEEFELAAENMKQAASYGAPKAQSSYYIAESYRLSNRLFESKDYYKKAIDAGIEDEHAHFYYAFSLKAHGQYQDAKEQFKEYIDYGTNFDYLERAKTEIKNIEYLGELALKKRFYEVHNFKELNSQAIEYSPVMNGKKLYFTSSRGVGPMFAGQGTRFTDLFIWKFDGFTKYSGQAVSMPATINTQKRHEATCTFSEDGKYMVFSRSNSGKKTDITQEVDLFESNLVNGQWEEGKRLDSVCETLSWDSNPFLSPDGKRLYFSSNRDGGKGGDDIWYATRNEDGQWHEPVNYDKVNTSGSEQFPYQKATGEFYFSSDGHPGFGALDLFVYKKNADQKYSIKNLGLPINSSYDDFAITYKEARRGYFTSNRPEGKGDDDIYYFDYYDPTQEECCINGDTCCLIKYVLSGVVKGKIVIGDSVTEKEKVLPRSTVTLSDTLGNQINSVVTNTQGEFETFLKANQVYVLKAYHDGYITREELFTVGDQVVPTSKMADMEEDIVVNKTIVLLPLVKNLVIDFPAIRYNLAKWDIRPSAAVILDQMAKVMLDNPDLIVELGSHTDSRSSAKYNKDLSQKRAQSAVDYLISKGVAKERLTAKGYGEDEPFILTEDRLGIPAGTELTEAYILSIKDQKIREKAFELNRRTDFKIVGSIKEGKE